MIIPSLSALLALTKYILSGFRIEFLANFTPFVSFVARVVVSLGFKHRQT